MAKKMLPRTLKVMEYFRKHPDARVATVAGKFNIALSNAYQLRTRSRTGGQKADAINLEFVPMLEQPTEPSSVDLILGERGNRYGTFDSNAKTCQLLKNVLHSQDGWYRLSYVQREAVEMIMHKISRLVNGDSTYLDTVIDIAGYNQLMLKHMRDQNEGKKVE